MLHSATKFMGGHGDVMGGVVAAGEGWLPRLRQVRAVTGGLGVGSHYVRQVEPVEG